MDNQVLLTLGLVAICFLVGLVVVHFLHNPKKNKDKSSLDA